MYLYDESLALEPVLVAQGRDLRGIATLVRGCSGRPGSVMRERLTWYRCVGPTFSSLLQVDPVAHVPA